MDLDSQRGCPFYLGTANNKSMEVQVKDKAILKKWWFWVIVVIILGAVGAATQSSGNTNTANNPNHAQTATPSNNTTTLPKLNADDYKGKEGLVVYKELQGKGYKVEAEFEKQALTDINGKASDVFAPLDPNKIEDRQSVDAFVVGDFRQDGDSVKLTIAQAQDS